MLSVQKKVGLTMGISAFLVAVVNAIDLAETGSRSFFEILLNPYVYILLLAAAIPLLTALRDSRLSRYLQVTILLGLGLVSTLLNSPGDLTGIILVAFGLILGIQYELFGARFWPRLIVAMVLYGVFALIAVGYFFKRPLVTSLNYLVAAAGFLYIFWAVFAEEVRNRRRNERMLRDSERRFETIIKNSNIMATNQDRELRYTWIYNPHDFLNSSNAIGATDDVLFSPEVGPRLAEIKRQVLDSGRGVQEEFHARIKGEDRFFDLTVEPLYDDRRSIIGVNTASKDVTERVVLHDQLVQSERFAAAGHLATYIAHEVNSPLQGIASMLDYLRKSYSSQADLKESLDLINRAFSSIGATVKKLLDLNRPNDDRLDVVDLNDIIRSTFALTASMLKQNRVRVDLELSSTPLRVRGQHQRITQVFLNLINNAVESMERHEATMPRRISVTSVTKENWAVVEFKDSGPGFAEKSLRHAFEPFHSEKSRPGMGIGLSICLQILQGIGGMILASNCSEGGACFTVRIPTFQPSAGPASTELDTASRT